MKTKNHTSKRARGKTKPIKESQKEIGHAALIAEVDRKSIKRWFRRSFHGVTCGSYRVSRREWTHYRQRGWNDMSGMWKLAYSLSSTAWHSRLPSGRISPRSWIYSEHERMGQLAIRFTGNHRICVLSNNPHIPFGALIAITT